jgi:hypothetical protein
MKTRNVTYAAAAAAAVLAALLVPFLAGYL